MENQKLVGSRHLWILESALQISLRQHYNLYFQHSAIKKGKFHQLLIKGKIHYSVGKINQNQGYQKPTHETNG